MDWQTICIIDNKDGKDITDDVLSIRRDDYTSRYCITFANSSIEFQYGLNRITYLKNPIQLDLHGNLIFIQGKLHPEIKMILRFNNWCKILNCNGTRSTIPYTDIQFIKDRRTEKSISAMIDYLIEAAALDENGTSKEDDDPGFLVSQLKAMKSREDSILSTIMGKDAPRFVENRNPIIAPFSSNASQIRAIGYALGSSISIIQGPPGTGKTQTILNIISNLIVRGKTIAVVSGNNEATRNVYEKLEKEGLGSLCALLGNKANIEHFFSNQPSKECLRQSFSQIDRTASDQEMKQLASLVSNIYRAMSKKAELTAQIHELQIEKAVNDSDFDPTATPLPRNLLDVHKTSKECLQAAAYIEALYSKESWMLLKKLRMLYHFDFWPRKDFSPSAAIDHLQHQYYPKKIHELQSQIDDLEEQFPTENNSKTLASYQRKSLEYLLFLLKSKFSKLEDKKFTSRGYRADSSFLTHYPIVLSTTNSLQYCTPSGILFDYVIIDESSQVNLTSAFLALASARNAVIVGDPKQLPHIVPNKLKGPLDEIRKRYNLPAFIDYRRFSILESIVEEFGNTVPNVLLNEHYRCDPEIIEFCNKRFYDSKLIIQTQHRENCGITIIETPSHTAQGRANPRQAEIITSEILPSEKNKGDVGIVAPYRDQVSLVKQFVKSNDILVDTVHKFQGKERSTMILTTTSDRTAVYDDPEHIDFLNNPNLINVAISRAKKHLFVIATSEALNQEGTLLGDLSNYASYYASSSTRKKTNVLSVFDLMYDDYSPILQSMKNRMLKISEYESENIIATILDDLCKSKRYGLLSFKFNYPLRKILRADTISDFEDKNFMLAPGTHCDFVIFSNLDKRIQLIIEVDGKQHGKTIQKQRDKRKDRLLHAAGLKLMRIKTTDVLVKETIEALLA